MTPNENILPAPITLQIILENIFYGEFGMNEDDIDDEVEQQVFDSIIINQLVLPESEEQGAAEPESNEEQGAAEPESNEEQGAAEPESNEEQGAASLMDQLESDEELDPEDDITYDDLLLEEYFQNVIDQTETPSTSRGNLMHESFFYVPRRLFPIDSSDESDESD